MQAVLPLRTDCAILSKLRKLIFQFPELVACLGMRLFVLYTHSSPPNVTTSNDGHNYTRTAYVLHTWKIYREVYGIYQRGRREVDGTDKRYMLGPA